MTIINLPVGSYITIPIGDAAELTINAIPSKDPTPPPAPPPILIRFLAINKGIVEYSINADTKTHFAQAGDTLNFNYPTITGA